MWCAVLWFLYILWRVMVTIHVHCNCCKFDLLRILGVIFSMHAAFVGKYRWTNLSARLDLLKVTSTIGYGQNDGLTNGQNDGTKCWVDKLAEK